MLKKWCSTYWLRVVYALGILMLILQIVNWNNWNSQVKMLSAMAILLSVHVLEEWKIPGGFHYCYNLLFKSDIPSYPMNQLTDMFTNFAGEIFFFLIVFFFPCNGTTLAMTIFCFLEGILHPAMTVFMHFKLKAVGKKCYYAPGIITAFGFLANGILQTCYLADVVLTSHDIVIAIITLLIMIVGMILLPEHIWRNPQTPYKFETKGYFEKFNL